MQEENLISCAQFCLHHNIEVSFFHSLQEYGLVELITNEKDAFISSNQLGEVEKLIRLHYELGINLEGIDAIIHLLRKLEEVENERTALKNRLRLYESQ